MEKIVRSRLPILLMTKKKKKPDTKIVTKKIHQTFYHFLTKLTRQIAFTTE